MSTPAEKIGLHRVIRWAPVGDIMHAIQSMTVKVNTAEVLLKVRENYETHKKIVAEAKEGYKKEVEKKLKKSLKEVRSGKIVGTIHLTAPVDYSKVYETTIRMLELHTESAIELDSQQVRNLVMDEWDWKTSFIGSNALYSDTAKML
jgi:hypothetical protein